MKNYTQDEIVALLKSKSSDIPAIVVEGKDDNMVYRWLLQEVGVSSEHLLPCGGRNTLLQVFERRNEFTVPTLFIADKDMYVHGDVPEKYAEVHFTEGYSLENDLYFGRAIEQLLNKDEKADYEKARRNYVRYYASYHASQYEKFKKGEKYEFDSPYKILTDANELKNPIENPPEETFNYLWENYDLLVRGHSIFQLLQLFLSRKGRGSKYSNYNLYEICYKLYPTEYLYRLQDFIREFCTKNARQ